MTDIYIGGGLIAGMARKNFFSRDNDPATGEIDIPDSELYFGADELTPGEVPVEVWDSLDRKERRALKKRYRRSRRREVIGQAKDSFFSNDAVDEESRLYAFSAYLQGSVKRRLLWAVLAISIVVLLATLVVLLNKPGTSSEDFVPVKAQSSTVSFPLVGNS